MQLQHLEALVALAADGSLRASARRLGISQPALSKRLRALEDELGVALVQRSPRGVVLTTFGEAVHRRACGVTLETTRLREELAQMRGCLEGQVRIAVSPVPAVLLLPQVLTRFTRRLPGVQVIVQDGLYPAVLPELRSGVIDLALGPQPPEGLAGGDLLIEPMFNNELVVAARRDHPLVAARSMADLLQTRWLLHGPLSGPGSLMGPAFAACGLAPPRAVVQSTSFTATIALLQHSDLLSVLPRRLIDHREPDHGLVALPLREVLPAWDICLLSRAQVPLTPVARELAQLLRRLPLTRPHR
ncbi:MAG: LysR substrate-binding domain-containing protein [Burkholderiaceae bacterium]